MAPQPVRKLGDLTIISRALQWFLIGLNLPPRSLGSTTMAERSRQDDGASKKKRTAPVSNAAAADPGQLNTELPRRVDAVISLPETQFGKSCPNKNRGKQLKAAEQRGFDRMKAKGRNAMHMHATFGIERESSLVRDDNNDPAYAYGQTVIEQMQHSDNKQISGEHTKPELAKHQIEQNSHVYTLDDEDFSFAKIEDDIREFERQERIYAARQGCDVVCTGILPTIYPEDMIIDRVNSSARYRLLASAIHEMVKTGRIEPFFVSEIEGVEGKVVVDYHMKEAPKARGRRRKTEKTPEVVITHPRGSLTIENPSIILESVMTSLQVHIAVPDQRKYRGHHRVADWVSPLLISFSAASPLLFMQETGFQETRNGFVWQVATDPNRTGTLTEGWLQHTFEQIENAIKLEPLLDPDDGGGKKADTTDADEDAVNQKFKTTWAYNRLTLRVTKHGKIEARIENRVASAGPTITDEIAYCMLTQGAIPGLHDHFEKDLKIPISEAESEVLEKHVSSKDMKENYQRCCVDGLAAQFADVDGTHVNAQDILLNRVVPIAEKSLTERGFDEDDIAHYLGIVRERLEFDWSQIPDAPKEWQENKVGLNPADVILFLNRKFIADGIDDEKIRARMLVAELRDCAEHDRKIYERTKDRDGVGRGCGIAGWFKAKYGVTVH